jgi:ATP-dependent protease ClpP protease subunit
MRGDRDADFNLNPNPARAVWLDCRLNQALLDRLEPQILALTSQSREPITIFINSPGGETAIRQRILNLLAPCRTITVACPNAGSAAAVVLSSGDWAIVMPESKLVYHGTRIRAFDAITAERATRLAEVLKNSNDTAVASLVCKSARRFRFIVSAMRSSFEEHRANAGDPTLRDVECFTDLLHDKLSVGGQMVLLRAIVNWYRHRGEWSFFVALCCALKEGQNELSATDALWLGLIDSIRDPALGAFSRSSIPEIRRGIGASHEQSLASDPLRLASEQSQSE